MNKNVKKRWNGKMEKGDQRGSGKQTIKEEEREEGNQKGRIQ